MQNHYVGLIPYDSQLHYRVDLKCRKGNMAAASSRHCEQTSANNRGDTFQCSRGASISPPYRDLYVGGTISPFQTDAEAVTDSRPVLYYYPPPLSLSLFLCLPIPARLLILFKEDNTVGECPNFALLFVSRILYSSIYGRCIIDLSCLDCSRQQILIFNLKILAGIGSQKRWEGHIDFISQAPTSSFLALSMQIAVMFAVFILQDEAPSHFAIVKFCIVTVSGYALFFAS